MRRHSDGDTARRDLTESFEEAGEDDEELMPDETHRREGPAPLLPEP